MSEVHLRTNTIILRGLLVLQVCHVPDNRFNLVSVRCLDDVGYTIYLERANGTNYGFFSGCQRLQEVQLLLHGGERTRCIRHEYSFVMKYPPICNIGGSTILARR